MKRWMMWLMLLTFSAKLACSPAAQNAAEDAMSPDMVAPAEAAAVIPDLAEEGPRVLAVSPKENAQGVSPDTSVSVVFSKEMDGKSITGQTLSLWAAGKKCDAKVSYASQVATLVPKKLLEIGVTYEARLSKEVSDLGGRKLPAAKSWKFTCDTSWESPLELAKGNFVGGVDGYTRPWLHALFDVGGTAHVIWGPRTDSATAEGPVLLRSRPKGSTFWSMTTVLSGTEPALRNTVRVSGAQRKHLWAAWQSSKRSAIVAATYDTGKQKWSYPPMLKISSSSTCHMDLAGDDKGNAAAVWIVGDTIKGKTVYSVWFARYSAAATTWSKPTCLVTLDSLYSYLPRVLMNAAGTLFVVAWVEHGYGGPGYGCCYWRMAAMYLDDAKTRTWSSIHRFPLISGMTNSQGWHYLAMDSKGSTVLTYHAWDPYGQVNGTPDPYGRVYGATFDPQSKSWSAPVMLSPREISAENTRVHMDSSGWAIVSFTSYKYIAWAARRDPASGTWEIAAPINQSARRLFCSVVGHNGSSLALSGLSKYYPSEVWSHRLLSGSKATWQSPVKIGSGTYVEDVAASMAIDGRGLVAYADSIGLYAALYQ